MAQDVAEVRRDRSQCVATLLVRQALKWTYAYGYYLTEDEKAKKAFFEYLQLQAQSVLEKLLNCAEDISEFLTKRREIRFNNFRLKLSMLTTVAKNYFENRVEALENGLEEVHSQILNLQQQQEN
ncbi:putative E3 ubiquitin-protein ligase ARI7 [Morella rubra]|uniref:Putative E3 ubiquitin-protein ligase ARI7 n=1 Tax=Morella rubra TaxID=262757 RepID=A0A6A1V225_9ROSI|nr:putative E3 ubiquitin-protein ligase ARI7 [Morella rubra]